MTENVGHRKSVVEISISELNGGISRIHHVTLSTY